VSGAFTRGQITPQYGAGSPRRVAVNGLAQVHADPNEGMTAVSSPISGWASDGAPYYNSGYAPPYYGSMQTGGVVELALPPMSEQLDLTDMKTWDRPVYFSGPGAR
jgi:hypothetical protein